jgi:hypothetical protein
VVWIISPIHRAIDDKTAKDLLGENFRRQLLMDGQYGNITFICTKTDDIKNSEIIRSALLYLCIYHIAWDFISEYYSG